MYTQISVKTGDLYPLYTINKVYQGFKNGTLLAILIVNIITLLY